MTATSPPEPTERQVVVGSFGWNLGEIGEGSPVVLLHGWPDAWRLWRYQLPALAASGRRAIAPDLPGLGRSARPGSLDGYRLDRVASAVLELFDALGIERCAVVGHDWGAALAWVLAALAPDRIERLVAVSVGHPGAFAGAGSAQRQRSWYVLWFLFPGVAETVLSAGSFGGLRRFLAAASNQVEDADLERQVADLSRPGALAASLSWYRANFSPETFIVEDPPALPPVRCPTMGVWSTGDVALTEEQMTGSARFVEGGRWRYERLLDVDHWIPVRAAQSLNELLLDFFSEG